MELIFSVLLLMGVVEKEAHFTICQTINITADQETERKAGSRVLQRSNQ